jgi:hypothetical protein
LKRLAYATFLAVLTAAAMLACNVRVDAFYCPFVRTIQATLNSPGELSVFDSEGLVTGLVDGRVVNEIPASNFSDNTVTLSFPQDSYLYRVSGTTQGSYGLTVKATLRKGSATFTAVDIPISLDEVHQYTINWTALSEGGKGVTVHVDSNNDGIFERNLTAGVELTSAEFMTATRITDINRDGKINIQDVALVATALGSQVGDQKWNTEADLDKNGTINIIDITTVAKDYGKTA